MIELIRLDFWHKLIQLIFSLWYIKYLSVYYLNIYSKEVTEGKEVTEMQMQMIHSVVGH